MEAQSKYQHMGLRDEETPSQHKAVLLALLIGFTGAHHYYLGQPKRAIIYLLTCWTLVPLALALVEAFQLFCMSKTEFNQIYGFWIE